MSNMEPTRSDFVAALGNPVFVAAASLETGSQLRRLVSERLRAHGIEVVVVAANVIGALPPFPGAEIIWQPALGGEFRRQLVRWTKDQTAEAMHAPGEAVHIFADCSQCGQHNEFIPGLDVTTAEICCIGCGSPLAAFPEEGIFDTSEQNEER